MGIAVHQQHLAGHRRAEAAWARLIRKVYESDPLECPKCKGPMRVIALIEDPVVVRAILTHLGRWQPKALDQVRARSDLSAASLARSGQTRAGFTITQVVHAPNARRPAHAKPNPPRANPVQARLAPYGGHELAAGG
jgi:hypothetical protein